MKTDEGSPSVVNKLYSLSDKDFETTSGLAPVDLSSLLARASGTFTGYPLHLSMARIIGTEISTRMENITRPYELVIFKSCTSSTDAL